MSATPSIGFIGASRYDADERVFAPLNESFPGLDWKKLADYGNATRRAGPK